MSVSDLVGGCVADDFCISDLEGRTRVGGANVNLVSSCENALGRCCATVFAALSPSSSSSSPSSSEIIFGRLVKLSCGSCSVIKSCCKSAYFA